jgi:hypothetical protein
MELPISFFLDYAWNPEAWNEDNIDSYYTCWSRQQFGANHEQEIGNILRLYSQYSARRKPELLDASTYSIENYSEAETILQQWSDLREMTEQIEAILPKEQSDAFFQLVSHPVKAFANLHQLYYAVAKNKKAAAQKFYEANTWAEQVKQRYLEDSLLTVKYHQLNSGKWNHMMSQTHIGYTYWQQPPVNKMPEVVELPDSAIVPPPEIALEDIEIIPVPEGAKGNVFYQEDGLVSIQAANWSKAISSKLISFKKIPGIGRTGDGVTSFPVTATAKFSAKSPGIEYEFYSGITDKATVHLYFSPTLNFHNNEGLQFAVSIDDAKPVVISLNKDDNTPAWNRWVADNIIIKTAEFPIKNGNKHILKYWMISPGVVLQKIVIDLGGLKPSYLGPPETRKK